MDRHALELNLCQANARVVVGQQALLKQRQHVRDLERYGLEAGTAKALLGIYEQSQAMNLFERERLRHALAHQAPEGIEPYDDIDLHYFERKAA
jgi:hypothetical protein